MTMDFLSLSRMDLQYAVEQLLRDYVESIDDDRLEEWPVFFVDDGLYEVISSANAERGMPAHAMRCEGAAMMRDRVVSLRQANIYAEQRYRHLVSNVNVKEASADRLIVQSNYAVIRTLALTGDPEMFSVGKTLDVVVAEGDRLKFRERRVIFDNERIHSLIVLPI